MKDKTHYSNHTYHNEDAKADTDTSLPPQKPSLRDLMMELQDQEFVITIPIENVGGDAHE